MQFRWKKYSVKDFDWTLKLNSIKIKFTKYKQAILNQVNNNSNDINIEHRENIKKFIGEVLNSKLELYTKELDALLISYGKSMKVK